MQAKLKLERPSKDFGEQLLNIEVAACSSNMVVGKKFGSFLIFPDLLGRNCLN